MISVEDVRKLVPREPPDGLTTWAAEGSVALDRDGLLIETVWAQDWSLEVMLDEWAQGRKVRAIRATCSACTESVLLWRAKDGYGNYGFVQDWDEDGPGRVCCDGDETTCPMCGARVVVRTKSKLRGKGYFVAGQEHVMSAAVVGRDRFLALTGWTVERRIYANARRELVAIPAEAYVFSDTECAQLMGWVNSYSGTAGYFIQYTREWRQPKDWRERWGSEEAIYGLTPELVAQSCLPHCKMDVYMDARPGADHYPVVYLRLYQAHSNVEALLVHGLPRVLDGLLEETAGRDDWTEKNKQALVDLPELRWDERRPAQMLGLTKEELRMAQMRDWDLFLWRLFHLSRAAGEVLTDQDVVNAFSLGDSNVIRIPGHGPVAKSLRYLLQQAMLYVPEPEDEDPLAMGCPDAQMLLDYWDLCVGLGRDLNDPMVRFPADLWDAHDQATEQTEDKADEEMCRLFRLRRKQLRKWCFEADGLLIRPAASQAELVKEGDSLHHCVKTYAKKHARGDSAIFFIRKKSAPATPFFTLELDEKNLGVIQNRGFRNCDRTPEVSAFEAKWLKWILAGAKRSRDGKPILENKRPHRARNAA